jgi:FKBP-type peptidyl-prolyl cis-trans isomerase FklB
MKRYFGVVPGVLALVIGVGGCTGNAKPTEPKDLKDRVSYSIGLKIGKDFKAQEVELNPEMLLSGVRHGLADAKPLLTDEQIQQTMEEFQKDMIARQQSRQEKLATDNLAGGKKFLEENSKKAGVVTLPSGLQYKIVEEGSGKQPSAEDTVKVHYRGTLVDGTEFDSSYARNTPATFQVSQVIPGWTEALQLMKAGSKWQIVLPPELAYGEQGAGPAIGPNAVLVFDVELLEVQ